MPPDHDRDAIERRLDAVERALADGEPIERVERLDDLEDRVVELEAAVQALRGYVGSVRAVNEDVERRADRALRRATALERHVAPGDAADPPPATDGGRAESAPDTGQGLRRTRDGVADGSNAHPGPETAGVRGPDSVLERLRRWL